MFGPGRPPLRARCRCPARPAIPGFPRCNGPRYHAGWSDAPKRWTGRFPVTGGRPGPRTAPGRAAFAPPWPARKYRSGPASPIAPRLAAPPSCPRHWALKSASAAPVHPAPGPVALPPGARPVPGSLPVPVAIHPVPPGWAAPRIVRGPSGPGPGAYPGDARFPRTVPGARYKGARRR